MTFKVMFGEGARQNIDDLLDFALRCAITAKATVADSPSGIPGSPLLLVGHDAAGPAPAPIGSRNVYMGQRGVAWFCLVTAAFTLVKTLGDRQ